MGSDSDAEGGPVPRVPPARRSVFSYLEASAIQLPTIFFRFCPRLLASSSDESINLPPKNHPHNLSFRVLSSIDVVGTVGDASVEAGSDSLVERIYVFGQRGLVDAR